MLLIYRSVGNANTNVIETIARNLAAEGIEIVDNTRTTNFLKNVEWRTWFDICISSSGCFVDIASVIKDIGNPTFAVCETKCPFLKYDEQIGYQYGRSTHLFATYTR